MAQARSVRPVRRSEVADGAREVDVIVVGVGCAGVCAAIEAVEAGAQVVALERLSGPGGSSIMSGGEVYLGGGTAQQHACGVEDSVEAMETYLIEALGPFADEAKVRLYARDSVEHHDWLVERGVVWGEGLYDDPTWMPSTTSGLMWMGERAHPFAEHARPAARGHRAPIPGYAGAGLMNPLLATAARVGVEIQTDTGVTNLIVDDDGRVVGVRARRFAETVDLLARRAVVLASGGFIDNEEMLAEHVPAMVGEGKVSDGGDDGLGIRIAQAAGAATRRMNTHQVSMSYVPAAAIRGLLVNSLGQRFVNEDRYAGLVCEAAFHTQPGPFYTIIDEEGLAAIPPLDAWGLRTHFAAESVEELESDLGMPAGALVATVTAYNEAAERGEDPMFHKASNWVRPLRGPLAAIAIAKGLGDTPPPGRGFTGFTTGGLHTDLDARVLDLDDRPIAGLFAAGRVANGMHGDGYISGTSLGDGTFFGRRAGRAAAAS